MFLAKHIIGMVLIHKYNLETSLKMFGDKGERVETKELTQLHNMVTFIPMDY